MKRVILCLVVLMGTFYHCLAGDDNPYEWMPPTGIGRGLVNILTSPGEVFRDAIYYGNYTYKDRPQLGGLDGFVFGAVVGSGMTLTRIVDGVVDVFTLGVAGNYYHGDAYPTFFWQDLWVPLNLD